MSNKTLDYNMCSTSAIKVRLQQGSLNKPPWLHHIVNRKVYSISYGYTNRFIGLE